jgi:hypothetical protein
MDEYCKNDHTLVEVAPHQFNHFDIVVLDIVT